MRKKLAIAVGLVAAVLTIMLGVELIPPAEPPLRVGMTGEEVDDALHQSVYSNWHNVKGMRLTNTGIWYELEPDWLGKRLDVLVFFDGEGRVESWETRRDFRNRRSASWWHRLKNVTGLK